MNILIATTEAVPFAKTGGLGDVCGALPLELARLGHKPVLIMPLFGHCRQANLAIDPTDIEFEISIGSKAVRGRLFEGRLPDSEVPVYFVEQNYYFDRNELYRESGQDYKDNCERFTFFCRAVMETIRLADLQPDVLHCNDWPTGLLPAYLKTEYHDQPGYEQIVSLMTIHNLAYQGTFWHWDMALTGLDWKYFNWRQMEFYGNLNLLKTGLAFADAVNTVSQRYAEEIQSAPLGCGLEGMLTHRRADLFGIINGVDYQIWNPATDPHLPANYDVSTFTEGKPRCKAELQKELGLPVDADAPLLGIVGRLADQKGFDLIAQVIQEWVLAYPVQWAILGTGEPAYHELLARLAERYPQRVAAKLTFSDPLAHWIEAGADMFLMPSRYEPCGLNQLYSLRYGTPPVVRSTGGLADTITNLSDEALANGTANGFSFHESSALALSETLHRACNTYRDKPVWNKLIHNGMSQDWSWGKSAREYSALYASLVERAKREVCI